MLLLLLLFLSGRAAAAPVTAVGDIGLAVRDLAAEVRFFTNVLPFQVVDRGVAEGPETDRLFGHDAGHPGRVEWVRLRLGEEFVTLSRHQGREPRRIPADSRSFDRWFQHIAIVVRDIDAAYAHLRSHQVPHVSTGPQTLPAWNPNAGGIRAFYFRDPEDHVLELISFPPGKGDPRWQRPADGLFLGIDHTAIVVADTDRSLAFYTNALGLRIAGTSENHGTEQEHLNQVFGARLRITALRAAGGPGVELLEYLTPPGGREYPADARAGDLVFWTTTLRVESVPAAAQDARRVLAGSGAGAPSFPADSARTLWRPVTQGAPASGAPYVLRDPDGHALQLAGAETPAERRTQAAVVETSPDAGRAPK